MKVKHVIRSIFRLTGYDIIKLKRTILPPLIIDQLLDNYKINVFLDVGANSGEFAEQIRHEFGYTKRIISFEPIVGVYELLKQRAKGDPNWEVRNFALGESDRESYINISGNSYSSSILDMLPAHQKVAPASKYISKERIDVRKLDSIFEDFIQPGDKVYLKIDAQGFEDKILEGAENSLAKIDLVQLEMSLVPLYVGQLLFDEIYNLMIGKGYNLVGIEPGFQDKVSGQLLQVDGFFLKSEKKD